MGKYKGYLIYLLGIVAFIIIGMKLTGESFENAGVKVLVVLVALNMNDVFWLKMRYWGERAGK